MQLNLADPSYGRLAGFAARLSRLLAHGTTQTDRAVAGTLDEFLGALYGLNLAQIQGFVDRPIGTDIEIRCCKNALENSLREIFGQMANGWQGFISTAGCYVCRRSTIVA